MLFSKRWKGKRNVVWGRVWRSRAKIFPHPTMVGNIKISFAVIFVRKTHESFFGKLNRTLFCLSSSQIAGRCDHRYFWKESVDILVIFPGVRDQKVTSESTTFSWAWPVVPLVQQDGKIFWSSIPAEEINW